MSNKGKAWPTLGYIKDSQDAALDGYLKLDKNLTLEVDGETLNVKSLNMPKYLTTYDSVNKREVIIGKLVKRREERDNPDSNLKVYIQLEPNVTFKYNGDKVQTSGFASLESAGAQLARLEQSLENNDITEDQYEQARTNISYSKAKVTLPPPRN